MKTTLTDIGGGIVWAASAVAVAGYTYDAYKQTYSRFPSAGGSDGNPSLFGFNSQETGKIAEQSLIAKLPGVGKPLVKASNWLGNLFSGSGLGQGPTSLDYKALERLKSLPAPPRAMLENVKAANKGSRAQLAPAANKLLAWALQHGWKKTDVDNLLKYEGVHIF